MLTPLLAELTIPENFWVGLIGTVVFGLIGLALMLLGYLGFDKITPKLDVQEQLNKGNTAVAIVVAGLFVGLAVIVAHVIH